MEIELCFAPVLHALAAFANPKDPRPQLPGVWVENSQTGLVLQATDGAAFAALRVGDMAPCESLALMLPCSAISKLPKKSANNAFLRFAEGHWSLGLDHALVPLTLDDLRPVDWRRVVPTSVTHEPAQFQPHLLSRYVALAKALGASSYLRVSYNGQDPARVHMPGQRDFVGVIQPLREHVTALPEDQPFNPPMLFRDTGQSLT